MPCSSFLQVLYIYVDELRVVLAVRIRVVQLYECVRHTLPPLSSLSPSRAYSAHAPPFTAHFPLFTAPFFPIYPLFIYVLTCVWILSALPMLWRRRRYGYCRHVWVPRAASPSARDASVGHQDGDGDSPAADVADGGGDGGGGGDDDDGDLVCFCIISEYPWHSFFRAVLDAMISVWEDGGGSAATVLESLFTQLVFAHEYRFGLMSRTDVSVTVNLPPKKGLISGVKLDITDGDADGGVNNGGGGVGSKKESALSSGGSGSGSGTTLSLTFTCPDASLPYQSFDPTIAMLEGALGTRSLMELLAALLCERRVLVTADSLELSAACVHGITTLLFPLTWQHIFIPALPPHLV